MDVTCLGELLMDMFPAEPGRRLEHVSAFRPVPGGAPANVAVGAARLGRNSAFIGKVGDDAFGRHLAGVLEREGVETRGMLFDSAVRTTLAFIAQPDAHSSQFLFYRNPGADTQLRTDELDLGLLAETRAFHFGSVCLSAEPVRETTAEAARVARRAGALISFDVNYRPTLWESPESAREIISGLVPLADVLKLNEIELALLTDSDDPEMGSRQLLRLGPSAVVVTLGAKGSYFGLAGGGEFVPAFTVRTVDSTGCGDAFVAGLMSKWTGLADWRQALTVPEMRRMISYANAAGALTAQKQGVIPALPTASEVDAFLAARPPA